MNNLVIDIINVTMSSLKERAYLLQMKRILNGIVSEDEHILKVKKLLNIVINKDIEDVKEFMTEIDELFDSSITTHIALKPSRYSLKYKTDFLKSLNVEKFISIVEGLTNDIGDNIAKLKISKGDKTISKLMDVISQSGKQLYDDLSALKVSDGASKVLIIDPYNQSVSMDSLMPVIDNSKDADSTVIKTFPLFDIVTYGGLKLGTSTLIAAKSGGFKSGTLQNICISAIINNDPSKFKVPPGKIPTVFLVSMENTKRQLYERHVSYFHNSEEEAKELTKNMTTEQIAMYISQHLTDTHKVKLPIIYIDRVGMTTTISDIGSVIAEYEQLGYHPILLGIDYLTKLTPDDPTYRKYSDTGADGGKKQAKKSEEIRNFLYDRNIAGVIPEQLATDAVHILESLRPDSRKIDPLYHTSMDMISGARNLPNEYENVIFLYKSEIADLEQNSDTIVIREYISMINKKSRETKSPYPLSNRDKINGPLYDLQVRKIKNSPLREKFKETGEMHAVSPLINYRISSEDWAKSIIMYYTSDNVDSMNLKDLMEDSRRVLTDVSDVFNDKPNQSSADLLGL